MIKVIIADDHAVVRTGLQLIFDTTADIAVVDEADRGNELLLKLKDNACDVVILDLSMPGRDGFDILKEIRKEYPDLPVIIFSMKPDDSYALRILRNGASAFINKEQPPEELINAVRMIARGEKYYTHRQAESLLNYFQKEKQSCTLFPHERLTDREFQILCMLAYGRKKKEIAEKLFISVNTINNHRNNILRKMELKGNSDLARYAVQHNLVE